MRDRTAATGLILRLANLAGGLAVAGYTGFMAARGVRLQWDFRVYLAAAQAAHAGLDPYVVENLVRVSGRPVPLAFLYPPAALLSFLALAAMPQPVALALWMSFKLLLLAGLVVLWKRVFVQDAGWFPLALVAVFGSNAAALWDLRSGNVALVEAALIWSALACFVAGRRRGFAALIVIAAVCKLAPALFLLLLLVPTSGQRARPKLLAAALAALGAIVFVPMWMGPAATWRGFLGASYGAFPVNEANPSALGFLVERFGGVTPAVVALWLAYLAALALLLARPLRRLARERDACAWAIAAVAIYLAAHPRPMAYGWVLGGGALVALIRAAAPGGLARAGLVALVLAQGVLWAFQQPWTGTLAGYMPVILLLALAALAAAAPRSGILQGDPA
ncbi:MAG: glycosyltransferase 87 family protein [Candidatus Eisenbacteria bacterium]